MAFLLGKYNLINEIKDYLNTNPDTQQILFHGIIDKEIICSTVEVVTNIAKPISFNVVIPKLKDFKLINWLPEYKDTHNQYKVRTNPKCCSQFIVIDDMFIFVSGNSKDNLHDFNDRAICFIEWENKIACDQLKDIFMNSWKGGFRLKL